MTPAAAIQNYLVLHLNREFPGIDIWRANVVGRKPGVSLVAAGEPGQADITGVWGGRCRICAHAMESPIHARREHDPGVHEPIPCGRSVWIEVKSPGDSQSAAQRDFERRVTRLGALYIICRVRKKETVAGLMDRIRKKETVAEFLDRIRPGGQQVTPAHPAEIASFFEELRGKL